MDADFDDKALYYLEVLAKRALQGDESARTTMAWHMDVLTRHGIALPAPVAAYFQEMLARPELLQQDRSGIERPSNLKDGWFDNPDDAKKWVRRARMSVDYRIVWNVSKATYRLQAVADAYRCDRKTLSRYYGLVSPVLDTYEQRRGKLTEVPDPIELYAALFETLNPGVIDFRELAASSWWYAPSALRREWEAWPDLNTTVGHLLRVTEKPPRKK